MKRHGVNCANAATLITLFLNHRVRKFTAKWHECSAQIGEKSKQLDATACNEFRSELRDEIQLALRLLSKSLSRLASVNI